MNYSIQFARPTRRRVNVSAAARSRAWSMLVAAYVAAHPGSHPEQVTVLEVALWQAARR